MKTKTSIVIVALAASAAMAQMPATAISNAKGAAAQMNNRAAQTNAVLPATTKKAATPATTAKPNSSASRMPAPVASAPAAKASVHTTKAAQSKPVAAQKSAAKKIDRSAAPAAQAPAASADPNAAPEVVRKRDPFVSPIITKVAGPTNCTGGKKCLVVDQVALKGVVRSQNGMIAVLVNAANKAYFMRENDPVYNGFVVKITQDSVVFRETVKDKLGKPETREVVKKVNTPAV